MSKNYYVCSTSWVRVAWHNARVSIAILGAMRSGEQDVLLT